MRCWLTGFGLVLGLLASGGAAHAQADLGFDGAPKVQVRFIAEQDGIAPGGSVGVALEQTIAEGWHTYWRNPGDSGAPTRIEWQLPPGWSVSDLAWPYPERLPIGPLMNYGYENEVALLFQVTAPADAVAGETVTLPADVSWLVCADVCIPEEASITLQIAVSAAPLAPAAETETFFQAARAKLPVDAGIAGLYEADPSRLTFHFENPLFAAAPPADAVFFPYTDGILEPAEPQQFQAGPQGLTLQTLPGRSLADPEGGSGITGIDGVLVLTSSAGAREAFVIAASPGLVAALPPVIRSDVGFLTALLFAFLGGIILNLMPCVLPVLSMKALAFAGKGGAAGTARKEALAYTGGVIATFLLLAGALLTLRAGGALIGWGFQLQQPVVVAALALLMFAVGLNLSGVFDIRAGRLAGAGTGLAAKAGASGSFFTGMLAVVVATPCTVPFMAAALGYAATQDAAIALSVFLALAIGFALPFLVLGFSPAVLRRLPRPGPWMEKLRRLLAIPMYGAALWLAWVLSRQTGQDGLVAFSVAALILGFALWAWGRSRASDRFAKVGTAGAVLGLIATAFLLFRVGDSAPADIAVAQGTLGYEPYAPQRLAELRAEGTPVFVNATAAWCITCLLNEEVALSGDALKSAFAQKGVVALKADWTNQDADITALLAEYGRNGVPLYLYFAPGAARAEVLPQLLTEGLVLNTLDGAS
jgi:thiol:disulfide interchange protein/DsbC/DsbD-like thiol-disulfide interchange protein